MYFFSNLILFLFFFLFFCDWCYTRSIARIDLVAHVGPLGRIAHLAHAARLLSLKLNSISIAPSVAVVALKGAFLNSFVFIVPSALTLHLKIERA